jgi:hypothetical protein
MSKNKIFKGKIILESLEDKNLVSKMQILGTEVAGAWTIHTILISKSDIENLMSYIKQGPWYAHFWHGNEVLVIFRDKIFKFLYNQPKSWREAIGYGISIGIPRRQLDFPIK